MTGLDELTSSFFVQCFNVQICKFYIKFRIVDIAQWIWVGDQKKAEFRHSTNKINKFLLHAITIKRCTFLITLCTMYPVGELYGA